MALNYCPDSFFQLGVTRNGGYGIPMKHFHIIRKNWREGKPWWLCSPVYPLNRQEIAKVVTA